MRCHGWDSAVRMGLAGRTNRAIVEARNAVARVRTIVKLCIDQLA